MLLLFTLIPFSSCNQGKGGKEEVKTDTFYYEEDKPCKLIRYGNYINKKYPNKDNELIQAKAEKEIRERFGNGKKDIRNDLVNVPVHFNEIIGEVSKDGSKKKYFMVSFDGNPLYGYNQYYAIDCVVDEKTAESLNGTDDYYLTMKEKAVYNKTKGYSFSGSSIGVGTGNVYLGSFIGGEAKITKEPEQEQKMRIDTIR